MRLMAASVVAAHNHVLRRYLRGESDDPAKEVDEALRQVVALFSVPDPGAAPGGTSVVAFQSDKGIDELVPLLRELLRAEGAS